jgi:FkbM family methyltransferase
LTAKDITDAHVVLQLFPGYQDSDLALFQQFANTDVKPEPGFIVDFMGSRMRTAWLWKEAQAFDGQRLGIPVPEDFHAETIEWIGLLKAVASAGDQYVAMELGAGFGPWTVAGAVAARRLGIKDIRLCAVEGDSRHFQWLRQNLVDNGFDPQQQTLFEAAVGVRAGQTQWPVDESTSCDFGRRPVPNGVDYRGREFQNTRTVEVIPILDLIVAQPRWDLVHIDVQGDEVNLCRSCLDELSNRVRRMIVGTHSRKIDGDLIDLMFAAGWLLEHEKPTRFYFVPGAPSLEAMTAGDGTQVWLNPRFFRPGDPLTSFSQRISSSVRNLNVKPREVIHLPLNVKNTGTQPWFTGVRIAPVNVSYRWLDSSGGELPIEGHRAQLTRNPVQPGQEDQLLLPVEAPPDPGSYTLAVSMVQESVAWFYARGAEPLRLPVIVTD